VVIQGGPGGQWPGPSLFARKLAVLTQRRMDKLSWVGWARGAVFGAVSLWAAPSAIAGEIRIDGGVCSAAVRLVARDATLSEVLKRLAGALDFQVSFETDSDPLVNIDAERTPVELVARLAALQNVSVTQAPDLRCPQRERIVKVWILPSGPGNVARTATAPQIARQRPEIDEHARRERAELNMILNAHGIPTAPEEQAESR